MLIEVSDFRAVLTIVFLNKSHEGPTPTVWVCKDRDAYDRALGKLAKRPHVEVIQHGPAHVEE